MDYVYCYLSYSGYKRGIQVMDGFWKEMDNLGVDDNPYRAGFLQLVAVSETDEQAEIDYGPHVDYFYKKCLHVFEGFADAPGYRTIRTMRTGAYSQVGSAATQKRKSLTWKDFVDDGYVIAGSPKTVIENLTKAVEGLRVGHLMVLLQIGSMPKDLTMKNTELFATEVLPHVRDMWSEYDDRWWPKPLEERAAVAGVGGDSHG
jgi:alkanesulfonate monooxygenase SsuD/methylene tetrahydromethanopterin reductase-like flavin-dependent oxidoreductase (luciferase family)